MQESTKSKEQTERLEQQFTPLLLWLKEVALKDRIEKAVLSQRLTRSPCALVASSYGWSGNMERIMQSQAYAKAKDPTQDFYATQKKTLEINPRHPVVKELLRRVEADQADQLAANSAQLLFETATLRSGFQLKDTLSFADRVDVMLKSSLALSQDEQPEEEEVEEDEPDTALPDEPAAAGGAAGEEDEDEQPHDEL